MAIRKYIIIVFIGSLNVLSAQYEGMSATPKDTVKPAVPNTGCCPNGKGNNAKSQPTEKCV